VVLAAIVKFITENYVFLFEIELVVSSILIILNFTENIVSSVLIIGVSVFVMLFAGNCHNRRE
jgi:hypothetical protein